MVCKGSKCKGEVDCDDCVKKVALKRKKVRDANLLMKAKIMSKMKGKPMPSQFDASPWYDNFASYRNLPRQQTALPPTKREVTLNDVEQQIQLALLKRDARKPRKAEAKAREAREAPEPLEAVRQPAVLSTDMETQYDVPMQSMGTQYEEPEVDEDYGDDYTVMPTQEQSEVEEYTVMPTQAEVEPVDAMTQADEMFKIETTGSHTMMPELTESATPIKRPTLPRQESDDSLDTLAERTYGSHTMMPEQEMFFAPTTQAEEAQFDYRSVRPAPIKLPDVARGSGLRAVYNLSPLPVEPVVPWAQWTPDVKETIEKPKVTLEPYDTTLTKVKGRGRPPGSSNKPKPAFEEQATKITSMLPLQANINPPRVEFLEEGEGVFQMKKDA